MTTFEAALLPDTEKHQLCLEVLAQHGVRVTRETGKGELIISCPIPGAHRNGDRNPSASLNFKKLVFRCLGCGARGGFIWLLATLRGEESQEARAWLEGATGTGGQEMELGTLLSVLDAISAGPSAPDPIPAYSMDSLRPWTSWGMHHPYLTDAEEIAPGIVGRGVPARTLEAFKVGYAPEYPMGVNRPTQERVVIPLIWRGSLVGWQARRIAPWDDPKYRFSPDFPRERVLFNYHHNYLGALVVESPLSVLRHHHHVPQVLSTYGAAVSDTQLRLLERYDRLLLWFDNDEAGWEATERVGHALESHADVLVVDNPYDADPADLPDEVVQELLGARVPFSVWERPTELVKYEGVS